MPYIEPTEIERVKRIDLLSYLQLNDPDELVRIGAGTYSTKTHDSLKISNGKWYWWSKGTGGKNALDYLITVKGMSFLEAAAHLGGMPVNIVSPAVTQSRSSGVSANTASNSPKKEIILPKPAPSNDAAIAYLANRGIDRNIIEHCISEGTLYASEHKGHTNTVFIGKDSEGTPRYASVRSTTGDFKGEAAGSEKRYAFRLGTQGQTSVHVFEGAVDVLSCAAIKQAAGMDWRDTSFLSLGGIPQQRERAVNETPGLPRALDQYLKDYPATKRVCLHLDNDVAGRTAAETIAKALAARSIEVKNAPPPDSHKDMNDYLMAKLKSAECPVKPAREARERKHDRER